MSRRMNASETMRQSRAKRDLALERNEFRYPSEPKVAPAGPISAPIKVHDPGDAALIEEFLANRSLR